MFSVFTGTSSYFSHSGLDSSAPRSDGGELENSEFPVSQTTANQVNSVAASLVGFISRILIEKNFFQNTQIPLETLLYLSNDLIRTIEPQKDEVFNMAEEIALIWKQLRCQQLSQQEQDYLDRPKQIDVPGEILNGLKYSSMALLGHSLYSSVTSTLAGKLWSHVPAICGYFTVALGGGQAVAYTVARLLENTELSEEQKTILEPWLNTVGRLAIGFVPKVHATEKGIHYQYPSLDGYTQTVSSDQTVTLSGNNLFVEKQGSLQTPEGAFEGVYESDFKLGEINELSQERIRIQVKNKYGVKIPVLFTKIMGQYGPEISISCEDKELEDRWGRYFRPEQKALPALNTEQQRDELYDNLSCKKGLALDRPVNLDGQLIGQAIPPFGFDISRLAQDSNTNLVLAFSVIAGLMRRGRSQHAQFPTALMTLLTLSLTSSVEAIRLPNPFRSMRNNLNKVVQESKIQAEYSLDKLHWIVTDLIKQVNDAGTEFTVKLGDKGQLIIREAGEELQFFADHVAEHTEATIRVVGHEATVVVGAAGSEARATVKCLGEEAKLIIQEGNKAALNLIAEIEQAANRTILNFGDQGQLIIEKTGETFNITASELLQKLFKHAEVTMEIAQEKTRLRIEDAGKEMRITIDHAKEQVLKATDKVFDIIDEKSVNGFEKLTRYAKAIASALVDGFQSSVFGESEIKRLTDDQASNFREGVSRGENKGQLIGKLLKRIQNQYQGTLSASERADLYIQLTKFVNSKDVSTDDQKWLQFVIAAIASQDRKLIETVKTLGVYSKTTDYFKTRFLLNVPDGEVKSAFSNSDFSILQEQCNNALEAYSNTFDLKTGLEKICFPGMEISSDNDNPVGTIISFPSGIVPQGYLHCDGQFYPKNKYSELYQLLKGHCLEEGENFQVPDLQDVFLRGIKINDLSEMGKFFEDTTRMPRKEFEITSSGAHVHTTRPSGIHEHDINEAGAHDHQVTESGEHIHTVSSGGEHQHRLSESGGHIHEIHNNGKHMHGMDEAGHHTHHDGPFSQICISDGHGTTSIRTDFTHGELNIMQSRTMPWNGQHSHIIHQNGEHSHTMSEAGKHLHEMDKAGGHTHDLTKTGNHSHGISFAPPHSHNITSSGLHVHDIPLSGNHTHEITGGDEETRPKNKKVAYLIKAESKTILTKQIKELMNQIRELREEVESRPTNSHVILSSLIIGALGILALRLPVFGGRGR